MDQDRYGDEQHAEQDVGDHWMLVDLVCAEFTAISAVYGVGRRYDMM
jgi:hypothetical protein